MDSKPLKTKFPFLLIYTEWPHGVETVSERKPVQMTRQGRRHANKIQHGARRCWSATTPIAGVSISLHLACQCPVAFPLVRAGITILCQQVVQKAYHRILFPDQHQDLWCGCLCYPEATASEAQMSDLCIQVSSGATFSVNCLHLTPLWFSIFGQQLIHFDNLKFAIC